MGQAVLSDPLTRYRDGVPVMSAVIVLDAAPCNERESG